MKQRFVDLPKRFSNLGTDAAGLLDAYRRFGFVVVGESVFEDAYIADVREGQGDWSVGHLPNDPKARLFYKGVHRATVMGDAIRFECRFEVRLLMQDLSGATRTPSEIAEMYGQGTPEAKACPMAWSAYDRLMRETVFAAGFMHIEDAYERTRELDKQKLSVAAWLDAHRPGWPDPASYWQP